VRYKVYTLFGWRPSLHGQGSQSTIFIKFRSDRFMLVEKNPDESQTESSAILCVPLWAGSATLRAVDKDVREAKTAWLQTGARALMLQPLSSSSFAVRT